MDASAMVYAAGLGNLGPGGGYDRAIDAYREPFLCNFAAYIKRLMDIYHQNSSQYPDLEAKAQLGDWEVYENAAQTMSRNRLSFTTKSGYMGLGPRYTQPGDQVCVFFGAKTPFILRKHEGKYRLIGDAYVHGAMDGEFVRQHEEGNIPQEVFEIH